MAAMALRSLRAEHSNSVGTAAQTAPMHLVDSELSPPMIHFEDLMPDARGEIVLHNDSSLRALNLVTSVSVIEHGETSAHVTLAGDDVSGFKVLKLANGVAVFYPRELVLSVTQPPPG